MSRDIPVNMIDADPQQPRRHFDDDALADLAASLSAQGQIVPITVRQVGERFIIVQGERRFRAACLAGLPTLRAEVVDIDEATAYWMALTENVQRADLTPLEEARAFQQLVDQGHTQGEIGKRVGKSQSYVAQKMRLLKMPEPLQVFLRYGALSEGHMRQVLRVQGIYGDDVVEDVQEEVIRRWADGDVTAGGQFDVEIAIMAFSADMRPLDLVWLIAPSQEHFGLYTDAMICYGRYCVDHDFRPPSWVGRAVWFAMAAVGYSLSVTDLKERIDYFQDILHSCVWWVGDDESPGKVGPSSTGLNKLVYFSAKSDLRHAGVHSIPKNLMLRAIMHVAEKDMYAYPSQFQVGGHHHAELMELEERERARGY